MSQKYELTYPQKSIWITEQFYNGTSINHICGTASFHIKLDFKILEDAIKKVVCKHQNFSLKISLEDNNPKQYLDKISNLEIKLTDVKTKGDLDKLTKDIVEIPFQLQDSYLFRFNMFRFPDNTGGYVLDIHHLIADAYTLGHVSSEIVNTYLDLVNNKNIDADLGIVDSYTDFVESEQSYINSDKFKRDEAYWNEKFDTIPSVASIPTNSSNNHSTSCVAKREEFMLSKDILSEIKDFCAKNRISLFNFFMAIYSIYIGKVSNLNDFVIGTPILNRTNFKEKSCFGMFISTVPFRVNLCSSNTFTEFVRTVCTDSLGMLKHQKYPYQLLLENLRKTNPTIPNLYNILISYQITNAKEIADDISYASKWNFNGNCADEINIHLFDLNDSGILNIAYDYQTQIYFLDDIEQIHSRIIHIIHQVLKNPNICLNNISIVTDEERNQLLYDFNKTDLDYKKDKYIIQYFEDIVEKKPNYPALIFRHSRFTYRQLNEKANSLAYELRKRGLKNNDIVGILVPRSFEMMIAILAVLKSGASYIPIDPDYPTDRINYMLDNSKTSLLLSIPKLIQKGNYSVDYIDISLNNTSIYDAHKQNIENISNPKDLSYIIYTSGSTGNPKGVMLNQQNLMNFYNAMINSAEYLTDNKHHKVLSITTVSFDIFLFETLISLTCGLTLYITDYYEQKITTKLERLVKENEIDVMQTTPSIMRFHLDNLNDISSFSSLKYITLAGEPLPKALITDIKNHYHGCTIYNGYGPSETTIFSTYTDVTNLEQITIGRPIANTQIYILGENLSVLPKYTLGEIYISGDGVGNGYLHRENLTKERFIENPFIPNTIMYRTGDLGYWKDDGTIQCKGRADNQIKLHGLRIELGEIEEKINSFTDDNLLRSAVIVKNKNGVSSLNAFMTYPYKLDIEGLKQYLLKNLPSYMLPSTYTLIDEFPFTPNGKIDRKALQNYEICTIAVLPDIALPRNDTEKLLVDTISKKLNTNSFVIDSNIFDYGADSLTIINILTDLFKYNLNLKVYDIYQHPTVRELYDNLLSKNDSKKDLDTSHYEELNKLVKSFSTTVNPQKNDKKLSILLTGCTGFFGVHILIELIKNNDSIEKIYCLIRNKNNIDMLERFWNKIHFYFGTTYDSLIRKYVTPVHGDVTSENLGLNKEDYLELVNNVNTVIHTAANVKHYGKYSDFELINITGTKHIIDFCSKCNAKLYHISTMTVSGNYLLEQENSGKIFDETSFYENQNFDDNVYAKSKLMAEMNILDAVKNGLNGTILRVGDLTGRYADGVFQENIQENSIYLRLKSIIEIGRIPESIKDNWLEFTPVDYAARAVCDIVHCNNSSKRIFHIYNPNMLKTYKLIEYVNKLDCPIKIIDTNDFNKIIKDFSASRTDKFKVSGLINDFTKDNDLVYNHTIPQFNEITVNYLKNLNFNWPDIDFNYIKNILEYMRKVKFI